MKTKSLKITEGIHSKYRAYCKTNGLKLNVFIDKILKEYWEKSIEKRRTKKLDENLSKFK